ncbi:MAG: hypothetical protein HY939_07460 [Gammaproteobacteria bacterium]|nr:hypothetical protein [Gammaproteobacteria bacterium]
MPSPSFLSESEHKSRKRVFGEEMLSAKRQERALRNCEYNEAHIAYVLNRAEGLAEMLVRWHDYFMMIGCQERLIEFARTDFGLLRIIQFANSLNELTQLGYDKPLILQMLFLKSTFLFLPAEFNGIHHTLSAYGLNHDQIARYFSSFLDSMQERMEGLAQFAKGVAVLSDSLQSSTITITSILNNEDGLMCLQRFVNYYPALRGEPGYTDSEAQCLLTHLQENLIEDILCWGPFLYLRFTCQQMVELSGSDAGRGLIKCQIEFLKTLNQLGYEAVLIKDLFLSDSIVTFPSEILLRTHCTLKTVGFGHKQIADCFKCCLSTEQDSSYLFDLLESVNHFLQFLSHERIIHSLKKENGLQKLHVFIDRCDRFRELGYGIFKSKNISKWLPENGVDVFIHLYPFLTDRYSHKQIDRLFVFDSPDGKIKNICLFLGLLEELHFTEECKGSLLMIEYDSGLLSKKLSHICFALEKNNFIYEYITHCISLAWLSMDRDVHGMEKFIEQLPMLSNFLSYEEIIFRLKDPKAILNPMGLLDNFKILISYYDNLKIYGREESHIKYLLTHLEEDETGVIQHILNWHPILAIKFDMDQLIEYSSTESGREIIKNLSEFLKTISDLGYVEQQQQEKLLVANQENVPLPDGFTQLHEDLKILGIDCHHLADYFIFFSTMSERMYWFQELKKCIQLLPDFVEFDSVVLMLESDKKLQKLQRLNEVLGEGSGLLPHQICAEVMSILEIEDNYYCGTIGSVAPTDSGETQAESFSSPGLFFRRSPLPLFAPGFDGSLEENEDEVLGVGHVPQSSKDPRPFS